tara:strand:- start:138 stop:1178 length:1041 start_codon:yes stop_codon:yes gene_type:complete
VSISESKILVVDDIEANRYTLERRLKRDGFTNITLADGGGAGLELVNSEDFDLILLDLMMPDISGLDVLKTIKQDPLHRHTPIIMVTAVGEIEPTVECIAAGADDYIAKPFNKTLLKARVEASLEKKILRDQEEVYLARIEEDKKQSLEWLRKFLPRNAASQIMSTGKVQPRRYEDVAIIVCDLYGFTKFCEINSPENVVEELEDVFGKFEKVFDLFNLEKIKTVGDCIVGASGISTVSRDPVKDVASCALDLISMSADERIKWKIHIGIHFGPVVAGVIGNDSIQYDFLGETVNTAFSICDLSEPNEILISNNAWMQSRNSVKVSSTGLSKLKGMTDYEIFKVNI